MSQLQGSACAGVPDAGAVELLLQLKGANDTVVAQCVEKIMLPSQFLGAEDRVTRMCQLHRDGEVIAKASVSYHMLAVAAQVLCFAVCVRDHLFAQSIVCTLGCSCNHVFVS